MLVAHAPCEMVLMTKTGRSGLAGAVRSEERA